MTNNRKKLSEDLAQRVFKTLLERFGEPIVDPVKTVGMRDERNQVKDEEDVIDDKPWSEYQKQPAKVSESIKSHEHSISCSDDCDEAYDAIDEVTPPGGEKVVKALKKQKNVKNPWAVAWSIKNKGAKFKK